MCAALTTNADFPEALQCLFTPARYIVLYGGRGGAKSWGVARWLIIRALGEGIRVLCTREVQKSIDESVKKLLTDQIKAMGLESEFDIQRDYIRAPKSGAEFFFAGLKDGADKIRSYEGVDVCWVEEAHRVSEASWQTLTPTIRKPGSTIVVTFNPQLETDATYVRFVKNKPSNAIVKKISWRDNPWFPEELRVEMEDLKARDYDSYLNVWEGFCKQILSGAVYADELRAAQAQGRILRVPYEASTSVNVFADLGWADKTSLWFAQHVGYEYRILKFYENSQQKWEHYLGYIQAQGYTIDTIFLPHDAKAKQLGTGRSIEEITRAKGFRVRIVPRLDIRDGINAVRTIFPQCYFDEEGCAEGLKALRSYRYEVQGEIKENQVWSQKPLHDWSSHAADAFRYFAVGSRLPRRRAPAGALIEDPQAFTDDWFSKLKRAVGAGHEQGWMK